MPRLTVLLNSLQKQNLAAQRERLKLPLTEDVPSADKFYEPAPDTPQAKTSSPSDESVAMAVTYQGHAAWSLFTALYFIACLAALGAGAYIMWRALNCSRRLRCSLIGVALLLSALVVSGFVWFISRPDNSEDVWTQLVNTTVNKDVHNIVAVYLGYDILGLALAVFLAFASSATLTRRPDGTASQRREHLATRLHHLSFLLYISTGLLIVATLRLNSLLHWALTYLQPPPWLPEADLKNALFIYQGVEGLSANLVTSMGVFYSLLLASAYIPAALTLNRRVAELTPDTNGPAGRSSLIPSLSEQFMRLAAILGPLLAGQVGDLLGSLR